MSGQALAMRLKLKRLAVQHRVCSAPITLPLFDPVPHDMLMEGYASTDDLDLDRCKMRPYAFGYPMRRQARGVPLLYKHDPKQVAGTIEDLEYDDFGNLCVLAVVTHECAKRCGAFSIRAVVNDYEIINGDTPDFYAIIKSAELTEISLTDNPSNPHALVLDRYRVSPAVQAYQLLAAKTQCLANWQTYFRKESK